MMNKRDKINAAVELHLENGGTVEELVDSKMLTIQEAAAWQIEEALLWSLGGGIDAANVGMLRCLVDETMRKAQPLAL